MAKKGVEAWRVFGTLGLDGLGKTTGQLRTFNAAGISVGKNIAKIDKKMLAMAGAAAVATGAVVLLGAKSVKAFAGFDAEMTKSLAIMGEVSDTLENDMAEAARNVARETLFSAEQAAESYFFLASAGLDAQQSIAALPQVAAFAQAGMFDMARATDLATDAQSALGLTVEDAEQNLSNLTRVTDVLVKANTLANATVEQFSTSLTSEAGAALKTVNKSVEEGVAVLAAYADQGVKAEKAGNALSRVIRMLTSQAVKNSEAYEKLGIDVFDTEGNLRHFGDIVNDMTAALGDMSDSQRAAALETLGFRARLQGVILPLLGTGDAIKQYNQGLNQSAGITQEVADKQLQTINKQMELLGGEIKDVLIGTGEWIAVSTDLVGVLRTTRTSIVFVRNAVSGMAEMWNTAGTAIENFGRSIPGLSKLFEIEDASNQHLSLARALEVEEQAARRAAAAQQRLADKIKEANAATLEARRRYADLIMEGRRLSASGGGATPRALTQAELFPEGTDFDLPDPAVIDDPLKHMRETLEQRWGQSMEGFNLIPTGEDKKKIMSDSLTELGQGAAKDSAEEILPTMQQVGGDLIRGLVDGSFDLKEFLKNSMITLASNFILGPFSGILGIASPSKVTAEMGKHMVTGLAMGIQQQARTGVVENAWQGVVGGLPSMADAAGRVRPSMNLNMDRLPPARNPLAVIRDQEWQEILRGSVEVAREDGARL